jgi:hypothetical protein
MARRCSACSSISAHDRLTAYLSKEVIRPQVPLRPPCYAFSLLAKLGFVTANHDRASPVPHSDGATGGVCKEQGRIHRAMMTRDY